MLFLSLIHISTNVTESEAAKNLVAKINALAKETLTVNHAARVKELRAEYDSLPEDQKKFVTNYDLLVGFESKIAELQKNQKDAGNATDISDGSGNVTGKTGTPVYYVSNLHAGKEFYLEMCIRDRPGCITCCQRWQDIPAMIADAKRAWITAAIEEGIRIPDNNMEG